MYKKTLSERVTDVLRMMRETIIPVNEIKKLSQKDFAQILGLSSKTVSDYECGRINIKLYILVRIVKVFGYDLVLTLVPKKSIDSDMEEYKRCVDLNMVLMDQPMDTVRRVLRDLGVDINL